MATFRSRVELQQLLRHVANGPLGPGLSRDPGCSAEFVELGFRTFGGRILLNEVQSLERHKQPIAALIEQDHAFLVVNEREAVVRADAVVDMDDVITRLEILKIR